MHDAVIRPVAVLEAGARYRRQATKTISSYLDSAKRLEAYLTTEGFPLEPEGIRASLVAERERTTPAPAAKLYRNLRVYFHWLLTEGEIKEDPMVRVEKPQVAVEAKPFFTDLKRGMELGPWALCIDRLATTLAEARALLADAVAILEARAAYQI